MRSLVLILSLALLIFGSVSVADATPVDFKIDVSSTDNKIGYNEEELKIVPDFTVLKVDPFKLEQGESFEFDYATIESINVIKDLSEYSITAYLSFILPKEIVVGSSGTVETIKVHGMGKREYDRFSISFVGEPVEFDTNGLFTVQLSSISLYTVPDTCSGCYYNTKSEGLITATVTLNSSPSPVAVPEPSTFILFGTILIGALGVKKIKG